MDIVEVFRIDGFRFGAVALLTARVIRASTRVEEPSD